jgi:tRNA modification GTPase
MTFRDTIAAIATPPGVGGIGLIRISGSEAERIARRLFRPLRPSAPLVSHHLYHGEIVATQTDDVLDEVLLAFMKAPHSYTGEDTVEISCHGGPLILRSVLAEALRAGARPAEPGEFTKRAFLNDRIDLTQAEAVLDLITARTPEGLSAAIKGLKGGLSERIEKLRERIVDALAGIEAAIDFTAEDGMTETPGGGEPAGLRAVLDQIRTLAASYRRGRIYREGIGVVITGRPNVGKSSLLNRLLGQRRAIVTPVPGTTRDFIEETLDIGGIPVRLTDTAGLRPPESAIEKAGIDLVWERLAGADIVLMLLDGSVELADDDRLIIAQVRDKPLLTVINKRDLPQRLDAKQFAGLLPETAPPVVRISAKYGEGLEALTEAIRNLALETPTEGTADPLVSHLRHKVALDRAAEHLSRTCDGLRDGLPPELAALDLREVLDALGEITGQTTTEEILARIFANFCVGK